MSDNARSSHILGHSILRWASSHPFFLRQFTDNFENDQTAILWISVNFRTMPVGEKNPTTTGVWTGATALLGKYTNYNTAMASIYRKLFLKNIFFLKKYANNICLYIEMIINKLTKNVSRLIKEAVTIMNATCTFNSSVMVALHCRFWKSIHANMQWVRCVSVIVIDIYLKS